jgi:tetratricopeptide (TPR) repeat protein
MKMLDNVTRRLRKKSSRLRKKVKKKLPVGGVTPAEREKAADIAEKGRQEYNMGLYPMAAKLFERALELDPRNQKALYSLGNTYYKLNRMQEARAKWDACIRVDPGDPIASKARRKNHHAAKLNVKLERQLRELEEDVLE